MSKKLFFLPFLMLLAITLIAPACDGDKCAKKDCGTGTCDDVDGTCLCDPGYEYDADGSCKVETRAKLIGKFDTSEKCDTETSSTPYTITIEAGTATTEVRIFNFFNAYASTAVNATVDGVNLTIAKQKPVSTVEVEGTGTISTNAAGKTQINLNYSVTDGTAAPFRCSTTVFVKQ